MKLKGLIIIVCLLFIYQSSPAQDWSSTNQKALEFYQQGRYEKSIRFSKQALQKAEEESGRISEPYISSLTNLAYAQFYLGEYNEALNNFKKLTDLSLQLYPLPHVSQMQTFMEVSKAYLNLAKYDSAEYYIDAARNIYLSIPKSNKPHYDSAIVSIYDASLKLTATEASILHKKGQVDRAIVLLQELRYSMKQVYPESYQELADYKTTINNLTTYYNEAFYLDKAKEYALEYASLVKEEKDPYNRIFSSQNLGSIYRNLEIYDSAIFFWKEGLKLAKSSNYKGTYIHTVLLNNLGELYAHLEDYDNSIKSLKESISIQTSKSSVSPPLYRTTRFNLAESYRWSGSYAEADSLYNDLIKEWIDDILHNFTYLSDNEKMSFYNQQQLFLDHYRSFALEVSGVLPLQGSEDPYIDPEVYGKLYDLQLTTKAIILNASRKMRKRILGSDNMELVRNYQQWEEMKYQLANALINGDKTDQEILIMEKNIDDIERLLIRSSNLFRSGFKFERVSWKQVQEKLKPGEAAVEMIRLVDGLVYGALILTPETKEQPLLSLVMSTRSKHLENEFYKNYYNSIIYQIEDTLSYPTYWQPIMDTLKKHMPEVKRLYLSNDGIYNRINPNTLKDPETGKYVIEQTEVVLLTNTREILEEKKTKDSKSLKRATLVGQPSFSLNEAEDDSSQSRGIRGETFLDLPGTGEEVQAIEQLLKKADWNTQLWTGEKATEKNLRESGHSNVLHIASHGYFNAQEPNGQSSFAQIMIGSGIAMAGVNDAPGHHGDGLLSAFEVIALDLDSTELVVLSACETGKGISHGEGVYGLQRALKVAGAGQLIMSLWKVDDRATQKLMTDFYRIWTETGELRSSFIQAQNNLRKEYKNPYYWGAFVLAGK